jgi:hypothetical protein
MLSSTAYGRNIIPPHICYSIIVQMIDFFGQFLKNSLANSPRSRKLSSSQNEHITRAIVEMVVLDYMPLKLVEDKGFLNFNEYPSSR